MFVAFEHVEPHSLIKSLSVGILLIYINERYVQLVKCPSHQTTTQSLPKIGGIKKKHLYFPLLHAHETDG